MQFFAGKMSVHLYRGILEIFWKNLIGVLAKNGKHDKFQSLILWEGSPFKCDGLLLCGFITQIEF